MNPGQRHVIGIFFLRTVHGVSRFWNVIGLYYVSYFHMFDTSIGENNMKDIPDLIDLFWSIGLLVGFYFQLYLRLRKTLAIWLIIMTISFFECQLMTDMQLFKMIFTSTIGISCGVSLMGVVYPLWERAKDENNRFDGLSAGFSAAVEILGVISAYILIGIANKKSEPPELFDGKMLYHPALHGSFLMSMIYYSGIMFLVGLIGILFMRNAFKSTTEMFRNSTEGLVNADGSGIDNDIKKIVEYRTKKNKFTRVTYSKIATILTTKEFMLIMVMFGLISFYRKYYFYVYTELFKENWHFTTGVIAQALGCLVIGRLVDVYKPFLVTLGCMALLIVHSCLSLYDFENFAYLLYYFLLFATTPMFLLVACKLREIFTEDYKEAFALSSIGVIAAYSIWMGVEKPSSNANHLIPLACIVISSILAFISFNPAKTKNN